MNKTQLETGDIVEIKCGKRYLVIKRKFENYSEVMIGVTGFLNLEDYRENLTNIYWDRYDIIKVYKPKFPGLIMSKITSNKEIDWTWIKQDEKIKEVIDATKKASKIIAEKIIDGMCEELTKSLTDIN